MPRYALARHVFVCTQGGHVVFLDVRQDRYFALEAATTAGLAELVPGWPVPTCSPDRTSTATTAGLSKLTSVVALLLEKGILTTSDSEGKSAIPVGVEPVRSEVVAECLDREPRVDLAIVLRFILAASCAKLLLRFRRFDDVVRRVTHRREHAAVEESTVDRARLGDLVGAFAKLRPFFFTAKDACLFDALALSEFLARHEVFPRWVFGVQARPFAAHCWLQMDGAVLNDTIDHVRRYTPIMFA